MERSSSNDIRYLISIEASSIDHLHAIYGWDHLLMAKESGAIWIKGFSKEELSSIPVKSIPNVSRYFAKTGKLFPIGKLLPIGNEPSLLWTPLKKGIFLELPSKNNNLFGLQSDIEIRIVPSKKEHKSNILLIELIELSNYIESASSIRLKPLLWTMIEKKALVIGAPMLPISGETYWKSGNHIIPGGYDFELPSLASFIDKKLNPTRDYDILWKVSGSYSLISKKEYVELSRSSVRLTKEFFENTNLKL